MLIMTKRNLRKRCLIGIPIPQQAISDSRLKTPKIENAIVDISVIFKRCKKETENKQKFIL